MHHIRGMGVRMLPVFIFEVFRNMHVGTNFDAMLPEFGNSLIGHR